MRSGAESFLWNQYAQLLDLKWKEEKETEESTDEQKRLCVDRMCCDARLLTFIARFTDILDV